MAGRLLRDPEQDGWERSDMPIICETCLGPNPFVRMQRVEYGGLCHISGRPYTVFRFRPGNDARYKKTVICQEVAKQKNVCQVCLLDLEYGLPVQVRDQALGIANDDEPESQVGKEFQLQKSIEEGNTSSSFAQSRPNELLARLQRTQPYYKRNQARVCSFFLKGECNRGAECPYRHEMPTTDKDLANQNYKDRYYGHNDPVANKMMKRAEGMTKLTPPEDTSITTLYVGGLSSEITEQDLRDQFYPFGEITGVRMVESKACAFVTYTQRSAAEKAAEELSGQLLVKGQRLRLMWGRPQEKPPAGQSDPMQPSTSGRPALIPHSVQTVMGAPPVQPPPNYFGLPVPQQQQPVYYPSMDPSAMGTRAADPGGAKRGAPGQDPGADPKRSRAGPPPPYGMPPPGMGYGYGGAPPGMGYGAPPPMHHHHMVPPPGGMPAAYPGMPPPRMPPPMATPHARPPPGAAPAAVPAAAASK